MSHRLNKSHLIICIIAALVIGVGIVVHYSMESLPISEDSNNYFVMALWVSLVIVIFYIVGHIARYVLVTGVYPPEVLDEAGGDVVELELADDMPMGVMEPVELTEIMVEHDDDDFDADIMYDEHMEGDLIENIALDAS